MFGSTRVSSLHECNRRQLIFLQHIYTNFLVPFSLSSHLNVRRFMRCFADISAINRENKGRYSLIINCITFAQYCNTGQIQRLYCLAFLTRSRPCLSHAKTRYKSRTQWSRQFMCERLLLDIADIF